MHTSTDLRSDHFEITVAGRPAQLETLFPGFTEHDRLGVVIGSDSGGAGASTVILAAVTAFYDRLRSAGEEFFAYPDYFAFHIGRSRGTLRKLDIFPAHKEIVVADDPEAILRAVNDRAITRLLVEQAHSDGGAEPSPRSGPQLAPGTGTSLSREARDSAQRRIRSALSYSPTGRVTSPDVVIRGSAQTEAYVEAMLAGAARDAAARDALRQGDRPVESFRRIPLERALDALTRCCEASRPGPRR